MNLCGPRKSYVKCSQAFRDHLMDAARVSNGKLVLLKRVAMDSMEVKIASYFSCQGIREDPRNHCIPVLDVIPDKDDSNKSYLVMPFLRYVDRPPFELIQRMLDCGERFSRYIPSHFQVLVFTSQQGLAFMHEHDVAHWYVDHLQMTSGTDWPLVVIVHTRIL